MKKNINKNGSVLVIVVFAIALLSTLVAGMLQANTEEIMLMTNHVNSVKSLEIARAGLNAAFAEIRQDSAWSTGFTSVSYGGGTYAVTVTGQSPSLTLDSTGLTADGFKTKVSADVTISQDGPYDIRVDQLRINK